MMEQKQVCLTAHKLGTIAKQLQQVASTLMRAGTQPAPPECCQDCVRLRSKETDAGTTYNCALGLWFPTSKLSCKRRCAPPSIRQLRNTGYVPPLDEGILGPLEKLSRLWYSIIGFLVCLPHGHNFYRGSRENPCCTVCNTTLKDYFRVA